MQSGNVALLLSNLHSKPIILLPVSSLPVKVKFVDVDIVEVPLITASPSPSTADVMLVSGSVVSKLGNIAILRGIGADLHKASGRNWIGGRMDGCPCPCQQVNAFIGDAGQPTRNLTNG